MLKRQVKKELDILILALLSKNPMCGIEIISAIREKFGFRLSPGTLYPMLQSLKKTGLIQHHQELKTKIFYIINSPLVSKKINERLEVSDRFNSYLRDIMGRVKK